MTIGIALPAQVAGVTRRDVLGYAERVERHGLDSLWSLGRLVYESLAPLPMLAAAAVTERVTIGTSILLANLWNPVRLANDAALDIDTLFMVPVMRDPEQVDRLAEAVAAFRQPTP